MAKMHAIEVANGQHRGARRRLRKTAVNEHRDEMSKGKAKGAEL
jgi:hypothetical protein